MDNTLITEEWLKEVGFKWHQLDRQPSKQWVLWLGECMGKYCSFEDFGIELAPTTATLRGEDNLWYCWLRSDSSHRYHRFIHVRYLNTKIGLIRLIEGLTGYTWNPGNIIRGSIYPPDIADRLHREHERLDLKLMSESTRWAEIEKDDSRGRALPEHYEAHEKSKEESKK